MRQRSTRNNSFELLTAVLKTSVGLNDSRRDCEGYIKIETVSGAGCLDFANDVLSDYSPYWSDVSSRNTVISP
jgi:hypothetical protein